MYIYYRLKSAILGLRADIARAFEVGSEVEPEVEVLLKSGETRLEEFFLDESGSYPAINVLLERSRASEPLSDGESTLLLSLLRFAFRQCPT